MIRRRPTAALSESFFRQVRQLLESSSNEVSVEVRPSLIAGAGRGVFLKKDAVITAASMHPPSGRVDDIADVNPPEEPRVLCLYPGVYTPPLPPWILAETSVEASLESLYLASETPPSGIAPNDNAYLLNLSTEVNGGYIDGATYDEAAIETCPGWWGHLINHCGEDHVANVDVRSFLWKDALGYGFLEPGVPDNDNEDHDHHPSLPNSMRLDGSPWYFDNVMEKVKYFPTPQQRHQVASLRPMLAGAAIVVGTPGLSPGDELLLHYGLKGPPYPNWAANWYKE